MSEVKRILVIDDEPDIRLYLTAALEDAGYEASTLEQHELTNEAVESRHPDLVVLDIMMPKRSGIAIYRDIRKSTTLATLPIVIVSGMAPSLRTLQEGIRELTGDDDLPPPDACLDKPVNIDALVRTVRELLNRG